MMQSLLKDDVDFLPPIEGLRYIPDWISADEEKTLLNEIDRNPWLSDLKRRVQHYGYKYDYTARRVDPDMYLGTLPDWSGFLIERLTRLQLFQQKPDQMIINEYMPGQGISAHIDCVPCFADTVVSLGLGSTATMMFDRTATGERYELPLHPRSLVVLSGSARYEWRHSIPARKADIIEGYKTERGRRVSLTLRKVLS